MKKKVHKCKKCMNKLLDWTNNLCSVDLAVVVLQDYPMVKEYIKCNSSPVKKNLQKLYDILQVVGDICYFYDILVFDKGLLYVVSLSLTLDQIMQL